jgi:hypothetical protein
MLDIVGAITLSSLALATIGVLVLSSPAGPTTRWRLALVAGAWLALVAGLAAAGIFADDGLGTPAIGVAVLAPVLIVAGGARAVPLVRRLALEIPPAVMVAVNAGRLLGVFFLLLHADGRLPWTFATSAGWGDITVGALALPLAWAVHRRAAGWRGLLLGWNAIGFVDLVVAVTLGVGSAPAMPLRFIFEEPGSGLMGVLPWLLIPGFLVPVYLLTHLALFAQRLAGRAVREAGPRRRIQEARAAGRRV